jgi:hypothetical protein
MYNGGNRHQLLVIFAYQSVYRADSGHLLDADCSSPDMIKIREEKTS